MQTVSGGITAPFAVLQRPWRDSRVSVGKELRRASAAMRNGRGGACLLFEQRRARFAKLC